MTDRMLRVAIPEGELALRVGAATDRGAVRAVNEDALLAEPPVFAVADGMGGHALGDRASAAAVAALAAALVPGAGIPPTPEAVREAVRRANAEVREVGAELRAGGAPEIGAGSIAGTTLAAVALVAAEGGPSAWMVVHVGDSRVYGWDGAVLRRLTRDHSLVQELQDAGVIDAEQAEHHPDRNVVTRALGARDDVDEDARVIALRLPGTAPALLVCSDGLTKELPDERIAELLREGADADALVAAALQEGGHDNVSVVLLHPEFAGLADPPVDEQTLDRMLGDHALSEELEDTRPRGRT